MRELITLACDKCRRRNYASTRNTKENPDRLELKKYCKFCRAQTPHRQTK